MSQIEVRKKERQNLEYFTRGMADNTRKNYYSAIKGYLAINLHIPIADLNNEETSKTIDSYIDCLIAKEKEKSGSAGEILINHIDRYATERSQTCNNTFYNQLHCVLKFLSANQFHFDQSDVKEWSTFNGKNFDGNTIDEMFKKEDLEKIANYAPFDLKPVILFAISTGMRPSEVLQTEFDDIETNEKPYGVKLYADRTKKEQFRRVFLTNEATEALSIWQKTDRTRYIHSVRNKAHGFKNDERIFPFSYDSYREKFNKVTDSLGMNQKDKKTNRRLFHLHGIRKFTRTALDNTGDLSKSKAIIGHDQSKNDRIYHRDHVDDLREWFNDKGNEALSLKTVERIEITPANIQETINQLIRDKNEMMAKIEVLTAANSKQTQI